VWGLRRHAAGLPPAIRPIEADLAHPSSLTALPAPLDAAIFAAAPEASEPDAYQRTYVRGLANLLAALERGGASERDLSRPRVILLSSTSVYGQSHGEWVDESSPTLPADFRGETVLRAEETLRRAPFESIVVRLGGLYGPGRASLVEAVRARRERPRPGPARFTNRIHRDDAVGAIVHLLDLPASSAAPVYLGVDHEPADRNQVIGWLAAQLRVSAEATAGEGQAGRARERDLGKRCSNSRLLASGYRFRYPTYREGYGALLGHNR
jgi:nucleoside-diphosphate-sugar epimerase